MWFYKHSFIRVFFDSPKDRPASWRDTWNEVKSESSKIETIDKDKLDSLTQKMLEDFLQGKTRSEATEFLKKFKEQIKKENIDPKLLEALGKKEQILLIWSNYNGILFGSSPEGEKKNITKEHQKALIDALWISGKEIKIPENPKPKTTDADKKPSTPEIDEKPKVIDQKLQQFLQENPIDTYKSKWIEMCLKHPQQIKDGMMGVGARILGRDSARSLQNELKILQWFWKEVPVEYKAFLETLNNITNSREFERYTWFLSEWVRKSIWEGANIEEFQKNFRNFMDLPVKEKKTLTKEDFDKQFDAKRNLTPEENKYVEAFYEETQNKIKDKIGNKEQINEINRIIQENTASNRPQAVINIINERLHVLSSWIYNAPSESLLTKISNTLSWSNETKENWEIAKKEADEKSKKGNQPFFVRFNTEQNKYEIISGEYIREQFTQKDMWNIEKTMFQSLVISHWWEDFFKRIGEEWTAAIWAYITTYPDSKLFDGLEAAKINEVKSFFENAYNATKKDQAEHIRKQIDKFWEKKFEELFPSLKDNGNITPEMQNALMKWNTDEFYNLLAQQKKTYGFIRDIMKQVETDTNWLSERLKTEVTKKSEQFKWKKISEFEGIFKLDIPADKKKYEEIKDKDIIGLSEENRKFLLNITDRNHKLYELLSSRTQLADANRMLWMSRLARREAEKHDENKTASPLSEDTKKFMKKGGDVYVAKGESDLNQKLTNKYSGIPGLEQFDSLGSIKKEIQRLEWLWELSETDSKKLTILKDRLQDKERLAIAVNSYVRTPGVSESDAIQFMKEATGKNISDKEMKQWIEGQQYISRYVAEGGKEGGNMEDAMARMSAWKTYEIGDFYGSKEKQEFAGSPINEFMKCKIEIGDGGYLTRTIRNPEWEIIEKDVPLENIDETLNQIQRLYTMWLWILAPKMKEINTAITNARPDAISGEKWIYGKVEDKKFLTIIATMLYGEENLPKEKNIPNMLQLFHRTDRQYDPILVMKQKWILNESWLVQSTILEKNLKNASSQIV